MTEPSVVSALTIAGSDSGGGAGIQADLKTFAAHRVHGLSAIAALTAQHTRGVTAVNVPPMDFLIAQLDACFDDFDIRAATGIGAGDGEGGNHGRFSHAGIVPSRSSSPVRSGLAFNRRMSGQPLPH